MTQPGISASAPRVGADRTDLAVVILTFNEEVHIERAIRSVAPIAREIVVVDSFSTDHTVEIASRLGARVVTHPFTNQAAQMQWALDHGGLEAAWVMRLDADEIIEADLREIIRDRLSGLPSDVTGVVLKRKHIFMGRWIRHGGRYPLFLLRLWRRGAARIEQRWMDEHAVLEHGRSTVFEGGFADDNLRDLSFFTAKHNGYATREAIEVLDQRLGLFQRDAAESLRSVSTQTMMRRGLKVGLYNRLGLFLGPSAYFLLRFVLQGGFLDGREGLVYHLLQGFWYRFLVGAKVMEMEKAIVGMNTRAEVIAELSRRTGLDLSGEV